MNSSPAASTVYLKPGELSIATSPTRVSTVLGSCVSLTLYCRRLSVGAICHAILPYGKKEASFRHVDSCIRYMLKRFDEQGIGRREIEVKLFGGADMLTGPSGRTTSLSVGQQNVDAALLMVEKEGLQLAASNVRGSQGRRIHFYTHTGEVLLKRFGTSSLQTGQSHDDEN